ncbi:MAG: response regulator [Chloroflexia bacterium]
MSGELETMLDMPEKKAIVVVEDSEPIAALIKDTLNGEPDYQATIVHDGSRAIEVIQSVKASLILLDLNLPGITGLQIYDLLKDDAATRDIPIVFITASPDRKAFKERNIESFIAKPFDLDELLDAVAQVCRG